MYRCDVCGVLAAPGQKERKLVSETRPKTYQHPIYPRSGSRRQRRIPIKFVESQGWEIAREVRVCGSEACAEKVAAMFAQSMEANAAARSAAATLADVAAEEAAPAQE